MSLRTMLRLSRLGGLVRRAARALRREDGSITVEMVITLPILLWAMTGTYVYFDAYKADTTNTRATYVLGDALSRETNFISPRYMDSLEELQAFLLQTDEDITLRITVVRYQERYDRHRVVWSEVRGDGVSPLRNSDIDSYFDRIPVTSNGGRMIMVESWSEYRPAFRVGLGDFQFHHMSVTRPRFAGQLCWNDNENGKLDNSTC